MAAGTTVDALLARAVQGHRSLNVPLASSYYEVKCAQGFRCISKVGVFGVGHDGAYHKPSVPDLKSRFREAYEWGCPARGSMTAAGECRDDGRGATSMCFSAVRYEAGPKAPCGTGDDCLCIKAGTPSGGWGPGHRHSDVLDGEELLTGGYAVQPPAKCEECAQHDCDERQCNECSGCEYTAKTIAGRKTRGCFELDGGSARREREESRAGRAYAPGRAPLRELLVLPHYDLWQPWPGRTRTPYEAPREPLSRRAWREAYKHAAPRLQRLLDRLVRQAREAWAAQDEATGAPSGQRLDCFHASARGGDDIDGKLERLQAVQAACREMQETARRIARGAPFADKAEDGAPVNCVMSDTGGGDCGALNCYTSDEGLAQALRALRARNRLCHLAHEYLGQEEARQGPAPEGSREPATAGRLEAPASGAARAAAALAPAPLWPACAASGQCRQRRRMAHRDFLFAQS
mmetsp:Transcript_8513/g.26475  ORF Transcript_8513/g.26475 Transcript_8513/m.26475 type:complete len:463 (+) Transcript_8513:83-1471(+)